MVDDYGREFNISNRYLKYDNLIVIYEFGAIFVDMLV